MRKNNTAIIFGGLFFSCSVMAANGTLAPTVVPMVNGGQASIAISNTSPNLFTVPGTRRTHGDVNVGTACRHPYDTGNVRPFHGGTGLCRCG
ncbi:hypothetical protein DAH50_24670 [Escherichia coli]|nr:hypothetical protein DAH50_24670 [Escherichia coli]